jgi:plasmid stabilization system protein ParE
VEAGGVRIKILSSATDDLYDGFRFYERQTPGLGIRFFRSLFTDIDSLLVHTGIHPVRFGYFRLLSKRFPYAIFYSLEEDVIVVRRVLDTRRDPARTRRALE